MQNSNSKKINPFVLFAFFIASIIIALPLRTYQLLKIVEPDTGFWIDKDVTAYVLYAVLLVFAFLIPFTTSFLHRGSLGAVPDNPEKSTTLAVISFIAAAALIYSAVIRYGESMDTYFAYIPGATELSFTSYLIKSGAAAKMLEAFFAVISAIFFLFFGICNLTKKSASEYKLLAIAPTAWCIFRIIHRFMRTISFLRVSELFLEMCMIVFLMMFFMAFAQVTAKVNGKGLEWKLYGYGIPAAALCLVCFLPRLVVTVIGRSDCLTTGSPIEYCDIAMAAFVIGILVSRARVFVKPVEAAAPEAIEATPDDDGSSDTVSNEE